MMACLVLEGPIDLFYTLVFPAQQDKNMVILDCYHSHKPWIPWKVAMYFIAFSKGIFISHPVGSDFMSYLFIRISYTILYNRWQ